MSTTESLFVLVNHILVHAVGGDRISFELAGAWTLPDPVIPPTNTPLQMTSAERKVLAWLQRYRETIIKAEQSWRVDREAIAGAIAWEAMKNVRDRPWDGTGRAVGPGKVHYSTERSWGEGNPLAKQVEDAGYLPNIDMDVRRGILRTTDGSINYIGACFAALADVAGKYGFNIRCRPEILTNAYQGRDLVLFDQDMRAKPKNAELKPGNLMALWVTDAKVRAYLNAGVGFRDAAICSPGFVGPPRP
jgi:hypothetical protein